MKENEGISSKVLRSIMRYNSIEITANVYVHLSEPDLRLPDEERPIGKYGCMHRDYLLEHNPMRFDDLVLEGQLWTYLAELNE